jgi:hypothetical protein
MIPSIPSMEGIVRNFSFRRAPKQFVPKPVEPAAATDEDGVLFWESSVRPETLTMNGAGWSITLKDVERSRTTSTKRVTNPNDPEDFVDVEVVDELLVRDRYGRTYRLQLINS